MSNSTDFERGRQRATLDSILDAIEKLEQESRARDEKLERQLFGDEPGKGVIGAHDKRLRSLETWRTFLAGAWAVIATKIGLGGHA